jgi:hypothetical protein
MKYTRYNLKKRKNDNVTLIVVLISILAASYLLGTGLSNMFIRNASPASRNNPSTPNSDKGQPRDNNGTGVRTENVIVKFVGIQNGYYSNKDNAEAMKAKVKEVLIPFTVEEDNKTRVFSGIFKEGEIVKSIQVLNENDIPNSKMTFEINKNNICDAVIAEVMSGYIEILTKLQEQDVKSIETEGFKKYVNSLEKVDEKNTNIAHLNDLKKHVNELPEKLTKGKVEESYIYIYDMLKKVSGK